MNDYQRYVRRQRRLDVLWAVIAWLGLIAVCLVAVVALWFLLAVFLSLGS